MLVIGEKINGTRPQIARAIAGRDEAMIQRLALSQIAAGAAYLDINAGTHPQKEPDDITWLIRTIKRVVDVPLCLDSANPEALRAGIAEVDQLPMINSASGEKRRLENVLPLAADHGTPLILLALDDKGIPKTSSDRMAIIEHLVSQARQNGLADDKLFVDPLVTTIATDRKSATVAFETMQKVKATFPDIHLTCGLSNISFGQPQRSTINQAFAALAIFAGLDCAIVDPEDKHLMGIILATEMLLEMDPNCLKYHSAIRAGTIAETKHLSQDADGPLKQALKGLLDAMSSAGLLQTAGSDKLEDNLISVQSSSIEAMPKDVSADHDAGLDGLIDALVNMRETDVMEYTEEHLSSGKDPMILLNASRQAMGIVGELFEKREYYVPQLMLAGEMLGQIAAAVKPYLKAGDQAGDKKARVLIGTVEGDIHDIGKDIVVTLLDINGYDVMDLGVDVPVDKFIAAAQAFKPQVVGLSGFLTLAYEPMKMTIAAIKAKGFENIKYMIGGGQMDEQVARYVDADAFGKDALEAVRLCDDWRGSLNAA